jgi:hypothetical protein
MAYLLRYSWSDFLSLPDLTLYMKSKKERLVLARIIRLKLLSYFKLAFYCLKLEGDQKVCAPDDYNTESYN